jgi:hypothetical protein
LSARGLAGLRSHRTFLDPENPTRAAAPTQVPDLTAFQEVLQSGAVAEAMGTTVCGPTPW